MSGSTIDSLKRLTEVGIDLKEVRVVSDDREAIISAVNALRETSPFRRQVG